MAFEFKKLGIEGFQDAKRYEKVRPAYTTEAVTFVMTKLGVLKENGEAGSDQMLNILELGAGTGKFTRVMADVLKHVNVRIVASDPVKAMCDQLKENLPDIEIKQISAEHIDAVNQSYDVVIAVGSFHWFPLPESLNEIHRVLIPGGMFGLIWNCLFYGITWQKTLCDYLAPMYERNSILWPTIHLQRLKEIVSSSGLFINEEENSHNFFKEKKLSPEQAFEYLKSFSVLNTCSAEEMMAFKALFNSTIEKIPTRSKEKELTVVFQMPIIWFKRTLNV